MKKPYLPRTENELRAWLNNLASKIASYATKYAITPAEVTDIQASATDFEAMINYTQALDTFLQGATARKAELRDGVPAGGTPSVPGTAPVAPTLSAAPGFLPRIVAIANRIKGSTAYTVADGEALGLEGTAVVVDLKTVKPRVTAITAFEDQVVIEWVKGRMQGVVVESSPDGSTWTHRDKDFKSPWEDKAPNRGTEAEWRHYRLRYLNNDTPVGLYSDPVRVLVSIH